LTVPNLQQVRWQKVILPDMLWLCSIISSNDEVLGMHACMQTLDVIDDVLAAHEIGSDDNDAVVIDGRLTTFEQVPVDIRGEIIDCLEANGLFEICVSERFSHALGMYPSAPGRWLIERRLRDGLSIDWEEAHRYLAPIIAESSHGQDRVPTRAKFIALTRQVKAGKILLPTSMESTADLLSRYPNQLSEDDLKKADSTIRAMFTAFSAVGGSEGGLSRSEEWGRVFWRSNWRIYPCSIADDASFLDNDLNPISATQQQFYDSIQRLHHSFLEAAQRTDPDLFEPDRYEVLTGITLRALRLVVAASLSPILWSGEHGFPFIRSLVEARIIFRWLTKKDDAAIYSRFKDYGRGRLKLLKLHLEDYADTLDEPPPDLAAYLAYLDAEVNQDVGEEWQNISIESTFSGVSARDMAGEVGMEREYRLVFAPASSATHGEWSSLDRYVLVRCQNPLHGGHRIPRSSLATPIGASFVQTMLDMASDLVSDYMKAIQCNIAEE
jgi:hypothetical protein